MAEWAAETGEAARDAQAGTAKEGGSTTSRGAEVTDPWMVACKRVEALGRTIGVVACWWALAVATAGIARAVWALVTIGLERR